MDQPSGLLKPEIDKLTTRERAAYKLSVQRRDPFLSGILAEQFYQLFETGKTCEEIQTLNPGISLGTVVRARIDGKWDERREAYLDGLMQKARTQAQQLSLESLGFIGDLLTAFHRHDRAKLQKFIQTGDVEELKGTMVDTPASLKFYRDVLDLLLRLTGQATDKRVHGVVEHHHRVTPVSATEPKVKKVTDILLQLPGEKNGGT